MADSTALYSYKGALPTTLPYKIRLSDGTVRTDVSSFTDEELTDVGYTGPYTVPSFNEASQRVTWNSSDLEYVVGDIPESELWDSIRAKRNQLLSECDWVMCSDTPGETSKNNIKEWEKYRQRLRDLTEDQTDPSSISWPLPPTAEGVVFDAAPVEELKLRHRVEDLEAKIVSLQEAIEDARVAPTRLETIEAKVAALEAK